MFSESIELILQIPLNGLFSSLKARLRHKHLLFLNAHDSSDIRKIIYLGMPSKIIMTTTDQYDMTVVLNKKKAIPKTQNVLCQTKNLVQNFQDCITESAIFVDR